MRQLGEIYNILDKCEGYFSLELRDPTDGNVALYEHWIECKHAVERKVQEVKDLEKQGKLLKLPCKAGQKVYLLRKDIKSVIDGEITSISISEFASGMRIFIIDDNRYTDSSFEKIGDIVFFTREEAEAALKELGKDKG